MKESFEPKKLLTLRILDILTEYSDYDHRLRQGEIMHLLKLLYDIECERKAVARNIEFLQIAGYDIVSDRDGAYLATRKYEAGELRLLIDSVLVNRNLCKKHTKDLIEKIASEGGKQFKTYAPSIINLDDWQKTENTNLLLDIELLCEAIKKKVQITFIYNHYGLDKKLHAVRKNPTTANPYALILKNAKYYLACNYNGCENLIFCRIDKMKNIVVTEQPVKEVTTVKNCENGINIAKMNNRLPYMFEDRPVRIELLCESYIMDDIIDWFGYSFEVKPTDENRFICYITASPGAMRYWILQFGKFVKVLSPKSFVDTIKADIDIMAKMYDNDK